MTQTDMDIQQDSPGLHSSADSLPLSWANHPGGNGTSMGTDERFDQLRARTEETTGLVLESIKSSNEQFKAFINSSNTRFVDIRRLEYYNRLAHARPLNSPAHLPKGSIYPLPLPNGEIRLRRSSRKTSMILDNSM
ncbi:hypothetical protein RSAG8_12750, partial [Rhizoctonia solani AG-8 WAC10335]